METEIKYLVIDQSDNMRFRPYAEQYMIFDKAEDAEQRMREGGYERSLLGLSSSWEPGVMTLYKSGDIDIKGMAIEVKKSVQTELAQQP